MSSLCAKHDGGIVWQDERTIDPPGFTQERFSLGSAGLTGMQREGYNKHLNEDYGALMLTRLLIRLDEISGGRVLDPPEGEFRPGRHDATPAGQELQAL